MTFISQMKRQIIFLGTKKSTITPWVSILEYPSRCFTMNYYIYIAVYIKFLNLKEVSHLKSIVYILFKNILWLFAMLKIILVLIHQYSIICMLSWYVKLILITAYLIHFQFSTIIKKMMEINLFIYP